MKSTDYAIEFRHEASMLIPLSELVESGEMSEKEAALADDSHIYLVCRRPSVTFCPRVTRFEQGRLVGEYRLSRGGKETREQFDIEFSLLDGCIRAEVSEYPHREIHVFDSSGDVIRRLPAWLVAHRLELEDAVDGVSIYDVVYVGQAFGKGDRAALDRLKSHSTLQRILTSTQATAPDQELVLLLLVGLDYQVITHIPPIPLAEAEQRVETDRFLAIHKSPFSRKQEVSIVEAILIRYFKPEFNLQFKDSFPSRSHKILQECYRFDVAMIAFVLDIEQLGIRLFSNQVAPMAGHLCKIALADEEERREFFHL